MRYFAMIDGRQLGPLELWELVDAGVRPDTYVWCKTMSDWQKARDVAEICRFYRQHLAGATLSGRSVESAESLPDDVNDDEALSRVPLRFRHLVEKSGVTPGIPTADEPDTSIPPRSYLGIAIAVTLFCFPLTGLVAIYFAVITRRLWAEGNTDRQDAKDYRQMAHEYSRQTKMWIGISFFLGIILYAFLGRML